MKTEEYVFVSVFLSLFSGGVIGYILGKTYSICETFEMYLKSKEYYELLPKYENLKKTIEIKKEKK